MVEPNHERPQPQSERPRILTAENEDVHVERIEFRSIDEIRSIHRKLRFGSIVLFCILSIFTVFSAFDQGRWDSSKLLIVIILLGIFALLIGATKSRLERKLFIKKK